MFGKKKSKKGFTLIELLSVIVILGILMLVAVPAVTRYIENSKKEAFIKEINSLVDTVRYGITSGDSNYQNKTTFDLKEIELEKGKNTIKEGILTVNTQTNTYRVRVTDEENNYCLMGYIDKLDKDDIVSCDSLNQIEYHISKGEYENQKISYKGSNWYVIEDSTYADDYVVLMREKALIVEELGGYARKSDQNTMQFGSSFNYEESTVKEFLENVYLNILNEDNLEEVNGHKIRLITKEELQDNLEYSKRYYQSWYDYYPKGEDTPQWVYNSFEEKECTESNNRCGYWTMTSNDSKSVVYYIWNNSYLYHADYRSYSQIRPVINLKKSAIK